MTNVKFCKDCKWHEEHRDEFLAACRHKSAEISSAVSPVTGVPSITNWRTCSLSRTLNGDEYCGTEGRFFSPKPPLRKMRDIIRLVIPSQIPPSERKS